MRNSLHWRAFLWKVKGCQLPCLKESSHEWELNNRSYEWYVESTSQEALLSEDWKDAASRWQEISAGALKIVSGQVSLPLTKQEAHRHKRRRYDLTLRANVFGPVDEDSSSDESDGDGPEGAEGESENNFEEVLALA